MNDTTTHLTHRWRKMVGITLATAIATMAGGACVQDIDGSDAEFYDDDGARRRLDDGVIDRRYEGEEGTGGGSAGGSFINDFAELESEELEDEEFVGEAECVATCVTCLYDICRDNGGSCNACKSSMETCKAECQQLED